MLIQCLGHSKFLLTLQSGYRIVTDPFDASTGYPVGDTEADAVLVSHHHSDHDAVDTVKGYMAHERETLVQVANLRNQSYDGMTDSDKIRTNTELSRNLGRIVAVAEDNPDLKASENFLQLSQMLYQVEDEIAQSRKYYNAVIRKYNTAVATFPGMLFAGMFGFHKKEMYEAEPLQRSDVKIQI